MPLITVQDLDIWEEAIGLVKSVHAAVRSWPVSQVNVISEQALRLSISIPVSLADARGRGDAAQARLFAEAAMGAAFELDTLLIIAAELGYQQVEETAALRGELAVVMRSIGHFMSCQEWKLRKVG